MDTHNMSMRAAYICNRTALTKSFCTAELVIIQKLLDTIDDRKVVDMVSKVMLDRQKEALDEPLKQRQEDLHAKPKAIETIKMKINGVGSDGKFKDVFESAWTKRERDLSEHEAKGAKKKRTQGKTAKK